MRQVECPRHRLAAARATSLFFSRRVDLSPVARTRSEASVVPTIGESPKKRLKVTADRLDRTKVITETECIRWSGARLVHVNDV
jgi:hypothetical protein